MQIGIPTRRRQAALDELLLVGRAARASQEASFPLRLPLNLCRVLLERDGPSLGLWRAAEVAALREEGYHRPILDLGCGDGLVMSLVLRRVEYGVDPDGCALARAATLGVHMSLIGTTIEQAELPAGSIQTIVSNSVLEHIDPIGPALTAAARLLRPGGRLVFTAPTEALSEMLLRREPGYVARRNALFQHRNLWPVERWAAELATAGLEIESVRPYLRPELVRLWDALELAQQFRLGRRRLGGMLWRRLPRRGLERLATRLARIDFSAPPPGGGRLVVARKV